MLLAELELNTHSIGEVADLLLRILQEAQALQAEGALSEEGVTDRPWH